MRSGVIGIFIILAVLIMGSNTLAFSQGNSLLNMNYNLISTDETNTGVKYTPVCIGTNGCHLPIKFMYNGTIAPASFSINISKLDNFNWSIAKLDPNSDTLVSDAKIMQIEKYNISRQTETCNPYSTAPNVTISNCTTITTITENSRNIWTSLSELGILTISKATWVYLDLIGGNKASLNKINSDIIPKIYGFNMPELAWWSTNWSYMRNETITSLENLTDFPYLINRTGVNGTLGLDVAALSGMNANCGDLRFLQDDEATLLNYEVSVCNSTAVQVWAQRSFVSTGTNITGIYYNSSGAADASNKRQTWDKNFTLVFHNDENTGASTAVNDSSQFNNNGTTTGSPDWVQGKFGYTLYYDQTGGGTPINYTSVPNSGSISFNQSENFTVEAWVNPDTFTGYQSAITIEGTQANTGTQFSMNTANGGVGRAVCCFGTNSVDSACAVGGTALNTGEWHYIACRYLAKPIRRIQVYLNGRFEASVQPTSVAGSVKGNQPLIIGGYASSQSYDGKVDEVRVSNIARSDEWINATYNRLTTSVGAQNSNITGGGGDTTKPNITINLPLNQTYATANQTVNATYNEAVDVCQAELNSVNYTFACNKNTSVIAAEGSNTLKVWANDTSGNLNVSETRSFSLGTTVPLILSREIHPSSPNVTDTINASGIFNCYETTLCNTTFRWLKNGNFVTNNTLLNFANNSNISNIYNGTFTRYDNITAEIRPYTTAAGFGLYQNVTAVAVATKTVTINFEPPTDVNGVVYNKSYTFVNVTVGNMSTIESVLIELNGNNITIDDRTLGFASGLDGTTPTDRSRNLKALTNIDISCGVAGKFNSACISDPIATGAGSGDRILQFPSVGAIPLNKSWSAEMWFQQNGSSNDDYILSFVDTQTNALFRFGVYTNGSVYFYVYNSSGTTNYIATYSGNFLTNWHYVAGIIDKIANTITIYVDGAKGGVVSIHSSLNISDDPASNSITIGNPDVDSLSHNTTIDEVRVWTRVITELEINNTWQAEVGKYYVNFTSLSSGAKTIIGIANTSDDVINRTETRTFTLQANVPPTVANLTLLPSAPNITDTLNVTTAVNFTTSSIGNVTFWWYKNNVSVTNNTLIAVGNNTNITNLYNGTFSHFDNITIEIRPTNGVYGNFSNATVTIQNTPPTTGTPTLTPASGYTNTVLTCTAASSADADSDPVTNNTAWLLNNTIISGQTSSTLNGSAQFNRGDSIRCQTTPNDRYVNGNASNSSNITIQDSPPTNATSLTSDKLRVGGIFNPIFTFTASGSADNDTDIITYEYESNSTGTFVNIGNGTLPTSGCLQETANVTTTCGGLSTGNYTQTGNASSPTLAYDGSYDTAADTAAGGELTIVYSKPINAQSTSKWQIMDGNTNPARINLTISQSCWDYSSSTIVLRARGTQTPNLYWECYNQSSLFEIVRTSSGDVQIFEEAMWWNISGHAVNWNVTNYTSGFFNIRTRATTTLNNSDYFQNTTAFEIDNTNPTVTINLPLNETTGIINQTINATFSEAVDICQLELNGASNYTVPCNKNTSVNLVNGTNTLRITANDTIGNVGTLIRVISLDDIIPNITINLPLNVTTGIISQTVNATINEAVDICKVELNGANTTFTCNTNTTINLVNGTNTVKIWSNDTYGNLNVSATRTISLDDIIPNITINLPINETTGIINQTINVTFNEPTDLCQAELNGVNNTFRCNTNTSVLLVNESNTLKVWANDTYGNINFSATTVITLDDTIPNITINLPLNQTYTVANQTVNATFSEFVDICKAEFNGANYTFACNKNTSVLLAEGINTLKIWANDSYGNLNVSETRSFSLDTTPPVITINAPENQTYSITNQTINATFDGPVDVCLVELNGGANFTSRCNKNTSVILAEGSNTIRVWANDSYGNYGLASRGVSLDTTPPVVTINAPANATFNMQNQTVNATFNEPVNTCLIELNGAINATFACNKNTSVIMVLGSNTIRIYANDSYGNYGTSTRFASYEGNSSQVTSFRFDFQQLQGNTRILLNGTITDTDSDVVSVVFTTGAILSLTNTSFSMNLSSTTFPINVVFRINDTAYHQTNYTLNISYGNVTTYQNSTAGNLTNQTVSRNISFIRTTPSVNYNISWGIATVTNGTAATPTNSNITEIGLTNYTIYADWYGDWIQETNASEKQDTSRTTQAGNNTYTNLTVELNDLLGINWKGITTTTYCRTGWTQNITLVNISASTNATIPLGCNGTNILTKTVTRYNVTDSGVTVDSNSTGFMEILINNTDTLISYVNVDVNVSSNLPIGWTLNQTSDENYTVTILLNNSNITSRNTTLVTTRPLIVELRTTEFASECTGFTIFTNYCYKTAVGSDGRSEYQVKSFFFVNDTTVGNKPITYNQLLARFVDWSSRELGTENITINSSSANTSLTAGSTNITVYVDTSHSTSSLSVVGHYNSIIRYYTPAAGQGDTGISGGGGGGGIPKTIVTVVDITATNVSIQPELGYILPARRSSNLTIEYILQNPNVNNQTLDVGFEHVTSITQNWYSFFQNGGIVSRQTIIVPGGSKVSPGQYVGKVNIQIPIDAINGDYVSYITISKNGKRISNIPITLKVGERFITEQLFDLMFTLPVYKLPKEFFGLMAIQTWMFSVPIIGVSSFAFARRSWSWGKGKR